MKTSDRQSNLLPSDNEIPRETLIISKNREIRICSTGFRGIAMFFWSQNPQKRENWSRNLQI